MQAFVRPGRRREPPAAEDEAEAEEAAEGEGDAHADRGDPERAQDHAHEVERRLLDLDPGDGLGGERGRDQRRRSSETTVLLRGPTVNFGLWVRLRASRYARTPSSRPVATCSRFSDFLSRFSSSGWLMKAISARMLGMLAPMRT